MAAADHPWNRALSLSPDSISGFPWLVFHVHCDQPVARCNGLLRVESLAGLGSLFATCIPADLTRAAASYMVFGHLKRRL